VRLLRRRLLILASLAFALASAGATRARAAADPRTRDLCGGKVRCFAKLVADGEGNVVTFPSPPRAALAPSDLASAYKLPPRGGAGKIVAVITAFDYPNAEADLATYRATFGLPPCTAATGCFTKIAEDGSSRYPEVDPEGCSGWNGEQALDLDMVSAGCPDCRILLVEANLAATPDFEAAVASALAAGAVAVSNSYGSPEQAVTSSNDAAYSSSVALITASAGDNGFGASFPATGSGVLAVGGTTLVRDGSSSRGWTETAWSGTGSGCSAFIDKPAWQHDVGCTMRIAVDVAAIADPGTQADPRGVATFCTDGAAGEAQAGWRVGGGTSTASPLVAAAFTLLGVRPEPGLPWRTRGAAFFDVTSGSNGSCAGYLCNAAVGYDGPTGWGTPNGELLGPNGALFRTDESLDPVVESAGPRGLQCSVRRPRGGSDGGWTGAAIVSALVATWRRKRRAVMSSRIARITCTPDPDHPDRGDT
jgi:hypothetical protein